MDKKKSKKVNRRRDIISSLPPSVAIINCHGPWEKWVMKLLFATHCVRMLDKWPVEIISGIMLITPETVQTIWSWSWHPASAAYWYPGLWLVSTAQCWPLIGCLGHKTHSGGSIWVSVKVGNYSVWDAWWLSGGHDRSGETGGLLWVSSECHTECVTPCPHTIRQRPLEHSER